MSFANEDGSKYIQSLLHTSPQRYEISKMEFEQNCCNMLDYLQTYNLNDCWLLLKSIEAYSKGFLNDFGVNVHKFMSLPGLAQHVAYKFYDTKAAPIYSFGESFSLYNQDIRNNLDGGLCMVFHRMMVVGQQNFLRENGEPLPEAALKTPNGEYFQRITSFDFNSLYPFALKQELPTGPGLLFEKRGNQFKMRSMHQSGKNSSLECIEWLEVII